MKRIARILTAFWALIFWRAKPVKQKPPYGIAVGRVMFGTLTPIPKVKEPSVETSDPKERQQVVLSDFGISFTFNGSLLADDYRNPMCPPKRLRLPVIPESDPRLN
jgi:hypothetical protein